MNKTSGVAQRERIAAFFDEASASRDSLFANEPVLGYEQEVRQRALMELVDPQPPDRILDVGCGNARDGTLIADNVALWAGVDVSLGMLQRGRTSLVDIGAPPLLAMSDAARLPFADGTFNKVYCSEVIEHVPEWERILPEIRRILCPRGLLVITTPNRISMYRPIRILTDTIRRIGGVARKHPYDEWKTLRGVHRALSAAGFGPIRAIGVCFVPGQWTYLVPRRVQSVIVAATRFLEPLLRTKVIWGGYMIATSASRMES